MPEDIVGLSNYQNGTSYSKRSSLLQGVRTNDQEAKYLPNEPANDPIKKREVYQFKADWMISTLAWQNEATDSFNIALSSFREDYTNHVQLVRLTEDTYNEEIHSITTFEHPYPATKIAWIPKGKSHGFPNLIATSADYLRLWRVQEKSKVQFGTDSKDHHSSDVKLESLLTSDDCALHCAPLTSFDWNDNDPSIIVTSSVDNTCSIWDIEVSKVIDTTTSQVSCSPTQCFVSSNLRSQLVAHKDQVNDVSFSQMGSGKDVFVTASSDGSVRIFDMRRLNVSTVLFEEKKSRSQTANNQSAMVRVCCSKQDPNLVSAFKVDSSDIYLLDIRKPCWPVATLDNHTGNLNSMSWAPHSAHHLCSAGEDNQALIWELSKLPNPIDEPLLAYKATGKINVISWSASHNDWIAIGFEDNLELLRV